MSEKSSAFVTVFTAFNPMDAHVVRSSLEAAGLHPFVAQEDAALGIEGYAMAAGGVLVRVPREEEEDARALIAARSGSA